MNRKSILAITCNIPYNNGGGGDQVDLYYMLKNISEIYDVYNISLFFEPKMPSDFDFKNVSENLDGEVFPFNIDKAINTLSRKSISNKYDKFFKILLGHHPLIALEEYYLPQILNRISEIFKERSFDLIFIEQGGTPLAKLAFSLRDYSNILLSIQDLFSLNAKREIKINSGIVK